MIVNYADDESQIKVVNQYIIEAQEKNVNYYKIGNHYLYVN